MYVDALKTSTNYSIGMPPTCELNTEAYIARSLLEVRCALEKDSQLSGCLSPQEPPYTTTYQALRNVQTRKPLEPSTLNPKPLNL